MFVGALCPQTVRPRDSGTRVKKTVSYFVIISWNRNRGKQKRKQVFKNDHVIDKPLKSYNEFEIKIIQRFYEFKHSILTLPN